MDVDDVQIAILDEAINSSSELSLDISSEMNKLAVLNRQAINKAAPLMRQISALKMKQKNLHAIENKVSAVKSYAGRISESLDALQSQLKSGFNDQKDIERYANALHQLQNIDIELQNVNLTQFQGLNKSLDQAISNGLINMQQALLQKVEKIGIIQLNGGSNAESDNLIKQSRYIYKYLLQEKNISLEQEIIEERVIFIKQEISKIKPVKPTINADQNYIYDGAKSSSFPDYTKLVKSAINREVAFITKFFDGLTNSLAKIVNIVIVPITDSLVSELTSMIDFISKNRNSYNTLYYELAVGAESMISWMNEYKLKYPSKLTELVQKCIKGAENTFSEFFHYIKESFANVSSNNNSSLNNTFFLINTRMNKLTAFKSYQLDYIASIKINAWLPQILPQGFISEKMESTDPRFLLGSFYSDIIEYSFYLLAEKYKNTLSEEDIGIALLINLDGLQSLLDGKSSLKQIIGKRGVERYEKLKKKAMDKAVSPWSTLTAQIMQASTMQGDNISMNNKDLIKFLDDFNIRIEELLKVLKTKEIPPFFRTQMISDIKKTLIPGYKIFFINISKQGGKSISKHIVYSPEKLENELLRV